MTAPPPAPTAAAPAPVLVPVLVPPAAAPPRPATGADAARDPDTSPLADFVDRRRGTAPRTSERARVLCEQLGDPHLALPAIHVAGTRGKTSVVRIVSALLAALGVHAGETTSPHLHDVGERIRLGDRGLPAWRLAAACADLPAAVAGAEARLDAPVTFFDVVTSVALRALADAAAEVAVVEAGIGGGGDATNVVAGRVAVLAPVGLDHPQLGATHAEIAAEKAAITMPGGVLVSAAQVPSAARAAARIAAGRGARLLRAGRDFGVVARAPVPGGQRVELAGLGGTRVSATLPLRGAHQAANAALALAAVQAHLPTTELDPARCAAGLASVRVPGRLEVLAGPRRSRVVLDGAHEPGALAALADAVREGWASTPTVVVLGVSGGREVAGMWAPLRRLRAEVVATAAAAPGATPAGRLGARLRAAGADASVEDAPLEALALAARRAGPGGLVVVTGSLHLIGEVRAALAAPSAEPGRVPATVRA